MGLFGKSSGNARSVVHCIDGETHEGLVEDCSLCYRKRQEKARKVVEAATIKLKSWTFKFKDSYGDRVPVVVAAEKFEQALETARIVANGQEPLEFAVNIGKIYLKRGSYV